MQRIITPSLAIAAILLVNTGCDEQRDLYVSPGPVLTVQGDWVPSLGRDDMTNDATVITHLIERDVVSRHYLLEADGVDIPIEHGTYDVLIFNGMMFDDVDNQLDGVTFQGSDRISTMMATIDPGEPNRRLSRADDEYIATNNMEILTSMIMREHYDTDDAAFYKKYDNGQMISNTVGDYILAQRRLEPHALSHRCQVTVWVSGIDNCLSINAALKGLSGSSSMTTHIPSREFTVTHQFNLNNRVDLGDGVGQVTSPEFVTFGPPHEDDREVILHIEYTLVNGEVEVEDVDVTEQLDAFLDMVHETHDDGEAEIHHNLKIEIMHETHIEDVVPVEGAIDLEDWGDDEIIHFPITR
ncbi:MAG: DUF5119 domain-containing protein [Alistipes sp.]|jgi:hypothetical protein|nr:DUF5119 domain-containing protein [Alistipes sp.]